VFHGDPPELRPAAPAACLVVPELAGLTLAGPLGDHYGDLAHALTRADWQVHVLFCGPDADPAAVRATSRDLARAEVGFTWLDRVDLPASVTLGGPNQFPGLDRSERVRQVLAELHRQHHFDLIEFPDRGGLGFRAVQARRMGLALTDTRLVVKVHGPDAWTRPAAGRWPLGPADLAADFCERYAFDHADYQLATTSSWYEEVRHLGWRVRSGARTCKGVDEDHAALYHGLLGTTPANPGLREPFPLVTIGVAHYNLGAYLGETLASLAAQTYPAFEVVVLDDGSTQPESREIFGKLRAQYPQFRFLTQANAGIGATRNQALAEARGVYFLPMDADNLAHPDMLRRLVLGMERNPDLGALGCYFLAFRETSEVAAGRFAYAYRPLGGPHVLASLWNVYGDGNALFRTEPLRAVGGFAIDRDTSWEDWEVFVKLVNAGFPVDTLPEPVLYYRHREAGFSRQTDGYRNHQRVLRRFVEVETLPTTERAALWNALAGFHRRLEYLEDENRTLHRRLACTRYRWADRLHALLGRIPWLRRAARRMLSHSAS
jgi:glycosyltransferase involved in cell wall biosynthesis